MSEGAPTMDAVYRARAVAAAKIAARYGVVCGGLDLDATLSALRARVIGARANVDEGERAVAAAIDRALAEAGLSLEVGG